MLVFHRERLILLAVPKTGSTALEAALAPRASLVLRDPPNLKHMTLVQVRRRIAPLFERDGDEPMQIMALVREPLDWLQSWYRYRYRDGLVGQRNSTRGMSFDDFVAAQMSDDPPPAAALGSQARFLSAMEGPSPADHLFRYEAMDHAVAYLRQRLEITIDLPRRNVSPRMEVTLDPALATRYRQAAAPEFALWQSAMGRG